MSAPLTLAELYAVPAVAKHTNCVSFATRDITAVWFRGVANREVVIPAIIKARNVRRRRNGDLCVWYNKNYDGEFAGYHFALYRNGYCYGKCGLGVEAKLRAVKYADACADESQNYTHFKIVRNFRLPVPSKRCLPIEKKVRRAIKKKKYGKIVKLFEAVDKFMVGAKMYIPTGKPINKEAKNEN